MSGKRTSPAGTSCSSIFPIRRRLPTEEHPMLNITPFGWFHTAISLVSLFGGLYALLRYHDIRYATPLGKTYTWFTVATCLTSFFLMRTGKLSEAHGLTVLTLIVL